MTTYDVVLFLVVVIWWLLFRREYERKSRCTYMGGVLFADFGCAILILMLLPRYPNLIHVPALLMAERAQVGSSVAAPSAVRFQ